MPQVEFQPLSPKKEQLSKTDVQTSGTVTHRIAWTHCGSPFNAMNPEEKSISFDVSSTWDSQPLDHRPVRISIGREQNGTLPITITGPLFNSPPAPPEPKGNVPGLWDYEVAEIFFLGDFGKYLELEFGPHGHYLALLLNGQSNSIKQGMPLHYEAIKDNKSWTGRVQLPVSYLPPNVSKINAYAIHGEDPNRVYEALYPVPMNAHEGPNFHRLQYFRNVDLRPLLTSCNTELSEVWEDAMKTPSGACT
ncbi:UPF0462 protein C4orf33 homolog [Galendromus occidentalis]|uniref:UPF0462 protein C4orf33 homolog n=1 Tax=Galendromus occidentalis TaxID=34638 RepID=A0AAJ6VZ42_9ACAR|nr:UPF0462 protein C4orf33 homolog [Galendromus occidentalis]